MDSTDGLTIARCSSNSSTDSSCSFPLLSWIHDSKDKQAITRLDDMYWSEVSVESLPLYNYPTEFASPLRDDSAFLEKWPLSHCSKYHAFDPNDHPLAWDVVVELRDYFKTIATEQLISNWRRRKSAADHETLWGDEIEYQLVKLRKGSPAMALLEQARVLTALQSSSDAACFQPEFAKCMVESNPLQPYCSKLEDLLEVEKSMRKRRRLIRQSLGEEESVLTVSTLPFLGVARPQLEPYHEPSTGALTSLSKYGDLVTDSVTAYNVVRNNLAARRRRNYNVEVPILQDEALPTSDKNECQSLAEPTHVMLDDYSFGTTQGGFQITMQSRNIDDARHLYDQLIPLAPIMLALTAATPIYKNRLVATDVRWNVLSGVSDDRTPEELANNTSLPSRWYPNTTYLGLEEEDAIDFEISSLPLDVDVMNSLVAAGMDRALARHFAHIMHWDPLKLMESDVIDAGKNVAHATNMFDLFNNSCWQGVRFKPPPGLSEPTAMGWRVEFRTMEVQRTDFENAAFGIFMHLVSRVIAEFKLMLHLPFNNINSNFDTAHHVNAVVQDKFWFRSAEWCDKDKRDSNGSQILPNQAPSSPAFVEMTIDEIINGRSTPGGSPVNSHRFPGFIPLIRLYLTRRNPQPDVETGINRYLNLVSQRASGASPTAATWMRSFVHSHRDYTGNSEVPETTCWELLKAVDEMQE